MPRDDAILSFERHATSKISTLGDLAAIGTLGFRGEALASIALVAKVELITKIEDSIEATRVLIEGGKFIDVKDAARERERPFRSATFSSTRPPAVNSCGLKLPRTTI